MSKKQRIIKTRVKKEGEIKITKVSKTTNFKSLASSIIESLKEGKIVKTQAIGESITILSKALALVECNSPFEIIYKPKVEVVDTPQGTMKAAMIWIISKQNQKQVI